MHRRFFLGATMLLPAAGLLVRSRRVLAAEHEVQMLNKGPEGQRNWFEPTVVQAQPGDSIREEPGLHALKCTPHFALGMVGLIAVGDPSINLETEGGALSGHGAPGDGRPPDGGRSEHVGRTEPPAGPRPAMVERMRRGGRVRVLIVAQNSVP